MAKAINRDELLKRCFGDKAPEIDKLLDSPQIAPTRTNRTYRSKRTNGPKLWVWNIVDNERIAIITGITGIVPIACLTVQ